MKIVTDDRDTICAASLPSGGTHLTHLDVLTEQVVGVEVHRREVADTVELEHNFHRMARHGKCVVAPPDPFVTWKQ
jgi:acyl-coenzyme A thioesterase PaaI-like protein